MGKFLVHFDLESKDGMEVGPLCWHGNMGLEFRSLTCIRDGMSILVSFTSLQAGMEMASFTCIRDGMSITYSFFCLFKGWDGNWLLLLVSGMGCQFFLLL